MKANPLCLSRKRPVATRKMRHAAALSFIGLLDVSSGRAGRPSGRKHSATQRLSTFATKSAERSGFVISVIVVAILGFGLGLADAEIRFEDAGRSTVGYLSDSGTVENASRSTLGYISDGTVENSGRSTLGYINEDGRIEDTSRTTLGYVSPDGRVENASRSTLGYINSDGRVEDSGRSTLGYANGYDGSQTAEVACFWFFFFTP